MCLALPQVPYQTGTDVRLVLLHDVIPNWLPSMFFNTSSTQHILRSHLICITSTTLVWSPQASQVEKRIIKRGQPGVSYGKSALKNNTTHISYFWIISWTFPCLHLWTTYHHLTTSVGGGGCQSECHRFGAEICYTIYSIQQLLCFLGGPNGFGWSWKIN